LSESNGKRNPIGELPGTKTISSSKSQAQLPNYQQHILSYCKTNPAGLFKPFLKAWLTYVSSTESFKFTFKGLIYIASLPLKPSR
jgi:hypothetical protein